MNIIPRRDFLKYTSLAIGSTAFISATDRASAEDPTTDLQSQSTDYSNLSPSEAISELMAGNQRFVQQTLQNPHQDRSRLKQTALAQSPFACVLTCSDSRVVPEIIFDRGLGDLFVVRDAGNIATAGEIGSLEYGVSVLGAKVILVMGHQNCGAVRAALELKSSSGFIASLINEILPAVEMAKQKNGELIYNSITTNILLQKRKIQTSPIISQLVTQNLLEVIGAYYDLETGKVTLL